MSGRKERCETCRFWDYEGRDTWEHENGVAAEGAVYESECHRFPPASGYYKQACKDGRNFVPHFPLTLGYSWCGEWQAKSEVSP